MSPPTPLLPLSDLESSLNTLPNGRARKPPVDLTRCALKELVQYKCNSDKPGHPGGGVIITCEPFVRLFRVCADGLHVETTAWEGWKARQEEGKKPT